MIINTCNCKKAKKVLRELVASSNNDPILFDNCAFVFNHEVDIFKACRYKTLPDINLRELKENRIYFSFLYNLICENEKLATVPAITKEQEANLSSLQHKLVTMQSTYANARDAMMIDANSASVANSSAIHRMHELSRGISEFKNINQILKLRSRKYNNERFFEIKHIIEYAANKARHLGKLNEISDADVELVAAAFYENLDFEKVPLILSIDEHIVIMCSFAASLYKPEQRELLREGIRTYRLPKRLLQSQPKTL